MVGHRLLLAGLIAKEYLRAQAVSSRWLVMRFGHQAESVQAARLMPIVMAADFADRLWRRRTLVDAPPCGRFEARYMSPSTISFSSL
jgi:hypothetical protein